MKDRSKNGFNLARFRTIVDAYGADSARWPEDERAEALALAERSTEATAILQEAARLDRLLDRAPGIEPSDDLMCAMAAIPDRHRPAVAPGAGQAPDAAEALPDLPGWRLLLPFDAPWKPALAAALACLLGIVTGVASLEPVADALVAVAPAAGAADIAATPPEDDEEAYLEDLTRLAFAADVDDVFASLTDVSDLDQEPQP